MQCPKLYDMSIRSMTAPIWNCLVLSVSVNPQPHALQMGRVTKFSKEKYWIQICRTVGCP